MLRTEGLRACYGLFQALFDVNIRVGRSEVVALIGSNGAGKSTLFRSIVGSVRVSPRSVWLDDVAVGGETERRQLNRGVVLVPEGRQLFPSLSVLENLQLAARYGRRGHSRGRGRGGASRAERSEPAVHSPPCSSARSSGTTLPVVTSR